MNSSLNRGLNSMLFAWPIFPLSACLKKFDSDFIIATNSGDVISGVTGAMELLTPKGGTQLAAMAEALAQTPVGAAIVRKLAGDKPKAA